MGIEDTSSVDQVLRTTVLPADRRRDHESLPDKHPTLRFDEAYST